MFLILGHLGPSLSHPVAFLGHLGPSASHLGAILGHLESSVSHLGAILVAMGGHPGPSWTPSCALNDFMSPCLNSRHLSYLSQDK